MSKAGRWPLPALEIVDGYRKPAAMKDLFPAMVFDAQVHALPKYYARSTVPADELDPVAMALFRNIDFGARCNGM
jgi:hypothetical protein